MRLFRNPLILKLSLCLTAFSTSADDSLTLISRVHFQGGYFSAEWEAPQTKLYKIFVFVPKDSENTAVIYRIYPQGHFAKNQICSRTELSPVCNEFVIDQARHQNQWVQLKLNANTDSQWRFVKQLGYVSVHNSAKTLERVSITAIRFQSSFVHPQYPKTGYSKIANNGSLLANTARLGTNPTDWACTRDNKTGLMWEIKTLDKGIRDMSNTYSWYNTDTKTNGGLEGVQSGGMCSGGTACDSESFKNAVNTHKLCGYDDWKLPTKEALMTLIDTHNTPAINLVYFPNTPSVRFWTATPYANSSYGAWLVNFHYGTVDFDTKQDANAIRLVRTGL
ncbi:MAG: hypothetical protein RL637_435 [Pseudomonadota bacterium]|jgi:hypothetical protein